VPLGPGRLGVLGWPVSHSRSPQMHEAAFAALGLRGWSYQRLPVPPELFSETVRALGAAGFVGANVTIPHKEAALALADRASRDAREIGAVNTLAFAPDGSIWAENTDAPAIVAEIPISLRGRAALVLGAGGSARAAIWALRNAGARVSVWNRTAERARKLAREFEVEALARPAQTDVLVNCTSVGLDESTSELELVLRQLDFTADQLGRCSCVVDLAYSVRPTALVLASRARGIPHVDGEQVLLAQGALSFEWWTDVRAPREAMRAALHASA
jgi:shikimate dehydrogenase